MTIYLRLLKIQNRFKNFTFPANFNLLVPTMTDFPFTDGSGDKPAQVAGFKLPGRTLFFPVWRAFSLHPTWFRISKGGFLPGDQKKELPFHVFRDIAPALFVAVDGFYGSRQQLR